MQFEIFMAVYSSEAECSGDSSLSIYKAGLESGNIVLKQVYLRFSSKFWKVGKKCIQT